MRGVERGGDGDGQKAEGIHIQLRQGRWNASVWKAQGIAFEDDVTLV